MTNMTKKATVENFEVVLEPEEDGGYHIFAPSLKGCHSYGTTKEEALRNIAEAIALWLESARELGIAIPERDTVTVRVE
ncbi:MAG: type II toxin-antitoxin system HicB family antitoxin [Chloroflexi bacterium]|nr:type II toxin-antitoxin system HicB family antitoxin [Chloroflexota bacterium]